MVPCLAAETVLDDFEGPVQRWGRGVAAEASRVKQGKQAMRWEPALGAHIGRSDIPHDWTRARSLEFWAYSEEATGSKTILQLSSDPPGKKGNYYIHSFAVDWTGWRRFRLALDRLGVARQPVGWHQIDAIALHGQGWGQAKPVPGTVLYFDDLRLVEYEGRALREALVRRGAATQGVLVPTGEGEHVLDVFGRGVPGAARSWKPAAGGPDRGSVPAQTWSWVSLGWEGAPRVRSWRREYDVDIRGLRTLSIRCRTSKGAGLSIAVQIDGRQSRPVVGRAGTAAFEEVCFGIDGETLQGLTLGLAAAGDGGARVDVEWIKLREPERPSASAWRHMTRGVCLTWERPWWGAAQYRVYRSKKPVTAAKLTDAEVVADHVGRGLCQAFDFPPAAGPWHYAVAPLAEGRPASLGESVQVDVPERPAPTIRPTARPIVIDGRLGEWPAPEPSDVYRVGGPDAMVHGAPIAGPRDCSASVTAAYDDAHLYFAVRVADDVARHSNSRPWEGDALVVMLKAGQRSGRFERPRYDLVTCWPLGQAKGYVLEDQRQAYGPDDKPVAPGSMASQVRPGGYDMEVAIPLAALREWGIGPAAGALLLGLSVYDGDQTNGPTRRDAAISWNQKTNLYTPKEAAAVRWGPCAR